MRFFMMILALATSLSARAAETELYDHATEGSPLLALIRGARHSLDIEIYTMDDPQVRSALRQALRREVKIRVVQETAPVGGCRVFESTPADAECEASRDFVREVRDAGGQYEPFRKDVFCPRSATTGKPANCFEHGKLALADRETALLSTGNFTASSLCDHRADPDRCNRDYSVIETRKDVVQALQQIFERDLAQKTYRLAPIVQKASALTVSPLSLDPLLRLIRSAKRSIRLQNQYLNDPRINDELVAAAGRGVRVQVMVSSLCSFGSPTGSARTKATQVYGRFDRAGIQTRMFSASIRVGGRKGYLHAKAIAVDAESSDAQAWVGSVNGSETAISQNREFGVLSDRPELIEKLASRLEADFQHPGAETWRQSLACLKD